jgi:DNA-binding beta-propeller fold protein YncE
MVGSVKVLPYFLTLAFAAFGDDRSSTALIPEGGEWEPVIEGTWVVCITSDNKGDFYFNPGREIGRGLFKLQADGTRVKIGSCENTVSMQWSPHGKLVCADNSGSGRLMDFRSVDAKASELDYKTERELATDVLPWKMAIAPDGKVYFADIIKNKICVCDPETKVVRDIGAMREPTAIAISQDGRTLYAGNKHQNEISTYAVAENGQVRPIPRKVVMERHWAPSDEFWMRKGQRPPDSANLHGLCTDSDDRLYAATSAGVQIFDAAGKFIGIIRNPSKEAIHAITLANDTLYICAGRAVYRRKIGAHGWAFGPK